MDILSLCDYDNKGQSILFELTHSVKNRMGFFKPQLFGTHSHTHGCAEVKSLTNRDPEYEVHTIMVSSARVNS